MRNQVLQTYADPLPLTQQKEFKQINNMIIQQAMPLGSLELHIARGDEQMQSQVY